jgi:hypothetical protein
MKVTVEKADAAELKRIEEQLRTLEFRLATLGAERSEILNRILGSAGVQVSNSTQISSPPDWSELLVTNNEKAQEQ